MGAHVSRAPLPWVSVESAAVALNVSTDALLRLVRSGRLQLEVLFDTAVVNRRELERARCCAEASAWRNAGLGWRA